MPDDGHARQHRHLHLRRPRDDRQRADLDAVPAVAGAGMARTRRGGGRIAPFDPARPATFEDCAVTSRRVRGGAAALSARRRPQPPGDRRRRARRRADSGGNRGHRSRPMCCIGGRTCGKPGRLRSRHAFSAPRASASTASPTSRSAPARASASAWRSRCRRGSFCSLTSCAPFVSIWSRVRRVSPCSALPCARAGA